MEESTFLVLEVLLVVAYEIVYKYQRKINLKNSDD